MTSLADSGSRPSAVLRFLTRSGPAGLVGWIIAFGAIARLIFGAAIDYGVGEAYYVAVVDEAQIGEADPKAPLMPFSLATRVPLMLLMAKSALR